MCAKFFGLFPPAGGLADAVIDETYHSEIILPRGDDFPVLDPRHGDVLALSTRADGKGGVVSEYVVSNVYRCRLLQRRR